MNSYLSKQAEQDLKQMVIDYLKQHQNFFCENEALLDQLNLPHMTSANSTSFIQHQLARAQEKNQLLHTQLNNITDTVEENSRLFAHLHHIILKVLRSDESNRLETLKEASVEHLSVEACVIWLNQLSVDLVTLDWFTEPMNQFDCSKPSAIEITEEQSNLLFENPVYQSACCVPLGTQGKYGAVIFGSTDNTRFAGNRDTQFLEQYEQIASATLKLQTS